MWLICLLKLTVMFFTPPSQVFCFPVYFGVFSPVCVAPSTAAALLGFFFFFLISILSLFEDYILISVCLISQRYDCACVFMCVCVSVHSTCFLVAAL